MVSLDRNVAGRAFPRGQWGNAIDFFVQVVGESFQQATETGRNSSS